MNLLEAASGLAVRYLGGRSITAQRESYFSLKTRMHPLLRLVHGSFDANQLRDPLEEKVGRDFEILMVHSSVNHMRPMYTGDALALVRTLIDFCGHDRTLVMPAFYFGEPEIGGAYATFKDNPRFDVRRTPSRMGLVTEMFRRTKGVIPSRHPVYRMSALGPLAPALTAGLEHASDPAGLGTPFEFMAKHNTRIIGIGKLILVLTQAHHVEGAMGAEFPVPGEPSPTVQVTLVDGKEDIPFVLGGYRLLWRFDIWRMRGIMKPATPREWQFHHVPMFSTTASEVTESLISAAHRGVTLYAKP